MYQETIVVVHEVAKRSHEGTIPFPEVVQKLTSAGVEQYFADLRRGSRTFYLPNGESHIEESSSPAATIGEQFSEAEIVSALRTIQRGEIDYQEFVRRIMAAGCTGYFVYIAGRQAHYLGRRGERYVERFPTPKAD
jgi:uncharacterized protein YbcV (DUF1398 family)